MRKITLLSILVFVLFSCKKEADQTTSPIEFGFGINQITRAQDDKFDVEDVVGVYNYTPANDILYSNVIFTNTTAGFKNFEPIYYGSEPEVNFIAYYPYSDQMNWSADTPIDWSVGEHQWLDKNYTVSDLMIAKVENVVKGTKQVDFDFNHLMSKVEINIIPGAGYTAEEIIGNVEIKICSTMLLCKVDVLASTISDLSGVGNIEPTKNYIIENGVIKGIYAIVIPQVIAKDNMLIEIAVAGVKYTYTPTSDFTFYQGKKTAFNLTINKQGAKFSVQITD